MRTVAKSNVYLFKVSHCKHAQQEKKMAQKELCQSVTGLLKHSSWKCPRLRLRPFPALTKGSSVLKCWSSFMLEHIPGL